MRTLWGTVLAWCLLATACEACTCNHWAWKRGGRRHQRPPVECPVEPAERVALPSVAPKPNVPLVTAGLALGLGSALGLVALFRKSL